MRTAILRSGILLALILGPSAATAQTELFFATGVDTTGWAQAQSNADGHVLIESPQYPLGLWLHLVDEAGDALAGIRVEYQGRADSLVAIRCVDPVGGVRETLVWTRPSGDPFRLTLPPSESVNLPEGFIPINWQIDPTTASLLKPVKKTRRIGWEGLAAFMRERWQNQTRRVVVRLDAHISLAVELDHPEAVEMLVAYLQQWHQSVGTPLGETTYIEIQIFETRLALQEGVILHASDSLFEDTNLEFVVRQALGLPEGFITLQEIASLTQLDADYKQISSLTGLEHLTELQSLDLQGNHQLPDVSPLTHLTKLQSLNLSTNDIADVSPLTHLTKLQSLNLKTNRITDVRPLASLINLTSLNLENNQIADLGPLVHLTNLTSLSLWRNQIADLTPLAALTNLKTLPLRTNQIADLSPLAHLTNLEGLDLRYNQIADLSPLAHLTNLKGLYLQDNQIADLSPLAHLTNLKDLRLEHNRITDVSPLVHLTNLNRLLLRYNRIEDITPLIANTGLGKGNQVFLEGNPLSDQARNEHIPALRARGVAVDYF